MMKKGLYSLLYKNKQPIYRNLFVVVEYMGFVTLVVGIFCTYFKYLKYFVKLIILMLIFVLLIFFSYY